MSAHRSLLSRRILLAFIIMFLTIKILGVVNFMIIKNNYSILNLKILLLYFYVVVKFIKLYATFSVHGL